MENLTLLNVFFNDYDVTYLVVILGIYGFCALCRIDNALESESFQKGARIVKMTAVLLLLSISTSAQTLKQVNENKFIVTNLSEHFDTTKLTFIRTSMAIDDTTTTEPVERFFTGRNYVKLSFDYWGEFVVTFRQKKNNGDWMIARFDILYFANKIKINRTVGVEFAVPKEVSDRNYINDRD